MKIRHVTLQDKSSMKLSLDQLDQVAQALQIQLDRDFTPIWGVHAQVQALDTGETVPARAWPMTILNQPSAGLGVHLDNKGKPFAEIQGGNDWSITASHELLEMLVDPLGHKLIRDLDIDTSAGEHQVEYLVEVGDPCEVFAYQIDGISVSDFITRDFYNTKAHAGTQFDFLGRLNKALDVPAGCYISWFDPQDGKWHQKQTDGSFITARQKANLDKSPRDERDAAFGDEDNKLRHDLQRIRAKYRPGATAKKTAGTT